MFTFIVWDGSSTSKPPHRLATYEQAKTVASHLSKSHDRIDIIYKGSVLASIPCGVDL
jgi:hypothetical protein